MTCKLDLLFEGFWQCRLATDPDPTEEKRGVSGYVFAVGYESDLDQIIKLQCDEIEPRDFRQPFPPYREQQTERFGVFVNRVEIGGCEQPDHPLLGASVRWLDRPKFALRNQIVGDGINRLAPPIVPFHIQVEKGKTVLRRFDPLDPSQPAKEIWELEPGAFERRVPVNYFHLFDESVETIFGAGVGDTDRRFNSFFQKRKDWLLVQLAENADDPVEREAYETRLFSIETHTGKPGGELGVIENRLGLATVWDFPIVGRSQVSGCEAIGEVLSGPDHPWHTRFWMGGWDGDLLVGYMRGSLQVPLAS